MTELSAFFYRQCHWMLTPSPRSSYYLAPLREMTEAQRLRYTDLLFLRLWPVPRAFFFSCKQTPTLTLPPPTVFVGSSLPCTHPHPGLALKPRVTPLLPFLASLKGSSKPFSLESESLWGPDGGK